MVPRPDSTGMSGFAARASAHIAADAGYLRTGQPVNATHFFWDTLIRDFRFPFLKKELLLLNPMSVPNLGDISGLLAHSDFAWEAIRELHVHTPGSLAPALPIHPSEPREDASTSGNDAGEGTAETGGDAQRLKRLVGSIKTWSRRQ